MKIRELGNKLFYLASPYNHAEESIRIKRYETAKLATGLLMMNGLKVFSPIVHNHSIAQVSELPKTWNFWKSYDQLYLERCDALIVLYDDGWEESVGVNEEIRIMQELNKIIFYYQPPFSPSSASHLSSYIYNYYIKKKYGGAAWV